MELPGEGSAGPGLVLRGARHPLLIDEVRSERLERVVPIDLRLGSEFDLLILTGPNTGGKTVALKTLGLAGLFARCGLPFPCREGSAVPLYEGVAVDVGDEQEIRQSLSTFSSHLVRIRDGLARAGEKTLVLLDELGGGTDPDEGAALGEAILDRDRTLAGDINPMLARHGESSEARQYSGRAVDDGWTCPFRDPRSEKS